MKLKEYIKDELFKIILIIVYIILICGLLCAFNFGVQMAALMAVHMGFLQKTEFL